jgi:hypothetical protein
MKTFMKQIKLFSLAAMLLLLVAACSKNNQLEPTPPLPTIPEKPEEPEAPKDSSIIWNSWAYYEGDDYITIRSLIHEFVDITSIKIENIYKDWMFLDYNNQRLFTYDKAGESSINTVLLKLKGSGYGYYDIPFKGIADEIVSDLYFGMYSRQFAEPISISENAELTSIDAEYDKCIITIGDTILNYNFYPTTGRILYIDVLHTPLQSIIVTADKSFGTSFPIGANLNSFFTIFINDILSTVKNHYIPIEDSYAVLSDLYRSDYRKAINDIILSNYIHSDSIVEIYQGLINLPDEYLLTPEERYYSLYPYKLSEISFLDHPYIGTNWYLYLDTLPEQTDTYVFTIEMTFVDGTVVKTTTEPLTIGQNKGT